MGLYRNMYSGAGVMIIEDYLTRSGQTVPSLVLVRNKSSECFSDFGGMYEKKHKSLEQTAQTELREESKNLFNISSEYLKNSKWVDIPAGRYFYRMYLIKINGISRKYFNHNKKIIDRNDMPRSWKETDQLTHLPIENIDYDQLNVRGRVLIKDVDGNMIELNGRAKKAIYCSKRKIRQIVKMRPTADLNNLLKIRSDDMTDGTYSYLLQ